MSYEEMLKKGREKIPKSVLDIERFIIPNVRGHLQGNKTVLSNFFQIADKLGRDPDFILKYIFKELGTPGEVKKPLVILGRKVSAKKINDKIESFAKKYVICNVFGKPETKLTKKNRIQFIKCNACGARYPVN
jgi:translation initiation factor 2 subunit 2